MTRRVSPPDQVYRVTPIRRSSRKSRDRFARLPRRTLSVTHVVEEKMRAEMLFRSAGRAREAALPMKINHLFFFSSFLAARINNTLSRSRVKIPSHTRTLKSRMRRDKNVRSRLQRWNSRGRESLVFI